MDPVDAFQRRFRSGAAMRPGVAAALAQMRFDLVANDAFGPWAPDSL